MRGGAAIVVGSRAPPARIVNFAGSRTSVSGLRAAEPAPPVGEAPALDALVVELEGAMLELDAELDVVVELGAVAEPDEALAERLAR